MRERSAEEAEEIRRGEMRAGDIDGSTGSVMLAFHGFLA